MIKRNPYLAAGISLLTPGLGHLYAGQIHRFAMAAMAVHAVIAALGILGVLSTYTGALAYVILLLALLPFGVVDSFVVARRKRMERFKWYNRWYFYIGFVAIVISLLGAHRLIRPILGFDLYRIKDGDVPPIVRMFDIVVIDTKAFRGRPPQQGDLVLVRRPASAVFIGRVTQPSSPTTFSYAIGSEKAENIGVPLNTIVGKPTYVLYSSTSGKAGKHLE